MLEISNLNKSYAGQMALENVSFEARRGEIIGLVGRNGAGKSTLMRLLAGSLPANAGVVRLEGKIDYPNQIRTLGYLPEGAPLYEELTPRQALAFVLGAHGFERAARRKRIDEILRQLDLGTVADKMLETLSKGYKRRTALGMALAPDPQLLLLDEPFDGFDPVQKHAAAALLRSLSTDKLVIISTHSLRDASRLCTRLIVLERGEIRADASPEVLLKQTGEKSLERAFRALVSASDEAHA